MNHEDTVAEIRLISEALASEPMFHASLGSKELFHSNLLGWMTQRSADLAAEVFRPWLTPAPERSQHRVLREHENIDLVLELPGFQAVIIENKTFSLPDESQLDRYTTGPIRKFADNPTLLLLSLIDPGWPGGVRTIAGREWMWVSYRTLGERLREVTRGASEFADQMLAHEAELLLLLDRLVIAAARPVGTEPLLMPAELHRPLADIRVADAVGKARAHLIMSRIRTAVAASAPGRAAATYEVGFSRGNVLLSAYWASR